LLISINSVLYATEKRTAEVHYFAALDQILVSHEIMFLIYCHVKVSFVYFFGHRLTSPLLLVAVLLSAGATYAAFLKYAETQLVILGTFTFCVSLTLLVPCQKGHPACENITWPNSW